MIKVRIAPSPTGNFHIGTARTALFNWLFARHLGGEFILRIEDTDRERSKPEYEDDIKKGLTWLGLNWDGQVYRQSERLAVYQRYLKELLDSGKAFWCHHTKEELTHEKEQQIKNKEPQRHLCNDKNEERGKIPGQIIRLAVDWDSSRIIQFKDLIRGDIPSQERLLGDISLAKDLDTPLYNFAVVVDDVEMGISHVIRGEDHISNTPKQILIHEALGKTQPYFGHLPLILSSDRSKISKRDGYNVNGIPTAISEYNKDYLPESLLNFIGFLGYTYSQEIMSKEDMAAEFDLAKVHRSGAVFDIKKLNWLNSQYVKKLPPENFKKLVNIPELSDEAVPLITERLEKLSDVQNFDYLWKMPEFDKELLKWKKSDLNKSLETLAEVKKLIENFDFDKGKDELRKILDDFSSKIGDRGLVYWPLRVALSGKDKSPDPVDIAFVLGKEKTLQRIDRAMGVTGN